MRKIVDYLAIIALILIMVAATVWGFIVEPVATISIGGFVIITASVVWLAERKENGNLFQ